MRLGCQPKMPTDITNINVSRFNPDHYGLTSEGWVWTAIEEPRSMDDFVTTSRREIDMMPGETKAISPGRWKIIKAIHLIAPSNEQVSFSMCVAIQ